jgi:hypothetical protein
MAATKSIFPKMPKDTNNARKIMPPKKSINGSVVIYTYTKSSVESDLNSLFKMLSFVIIRYRIFFPLYQIFSYGVSLPSLTLPLVRRKEKYSKQTPATNILPLTTKYRHLSGSIQGGQGTFGGQGTHCIVYVLA